MAMLNGRKTSYRKMLLTITGKQSKRHIYTWRTHRKRIKGKIITLDTQEGKAIKRSSSAAAAS